MRAMVVVCYVCCMWRANTVNERELDDQYRSKRQDNNNKDYDEDEDDGDSSSRDRRRYFFFTKETV